MSKNDLEERVKALEQQVAELQAAVANGARANDWRSTIGMFRGDETMGRICDAALAYREKDRERARRRYAKSKSKK
jgi:hypothetical protein